MQEPGGQAGTGRFNISIHRRGRGYPTSGRADGARLRFSLPFQRGKQGVVCSRARRRGGLRVHKVFYDNTNSLFPYGEDGRGVFMILF